MGSTQNSRRKSKMRLREEKERLGLCYICERKIEGKTRHCKFHNKSLRDYYRKRLKDKRKMVKFM